MHTALNHKQKKSALRPITFISLVCILLLALVFVLPKALHKKYIVPVLMYHSVSNENNPIMHRLIISPKTFQRQMLFLKEHHYNIISLGELSNLLSEKKDIPAKTIAITFDDGYKDNYEYAYPVFILI